MSRSGDPVSAGVRETSVGSRLDDAARISGRVAHDFDNLLMGIMGFAELAQSHVESGSRAGEYLEQLILVAERARTVTGQLHAFNRSGRANPSASRLADVFDPNGIGRTPDLANGVRVETALSAGLPAVAVGSEPLRIVLNHLLQNAAEAMSNGGRVTVSARFVALPDGLPDTMPCPIAAGDFVELTVADTGAGFHSSIAGRSGREPFVTTKLGHRGLGLPTVLRTLEAHGGGLRIESSPRGTAVVVYLPSADKDQPALSPCAADAGPLEVSPK